METLRPSNIGQDRDRFSALPDELLLGIIECLSLRDAVRVGAISTRWRHLPHQLSRVELNADDFQGTTPIETMEAFTGALCILLSACPPAESKCDCKSRRAVKILSLRFYPSAAHLESIGRAVEETVSRGETNRFEFELIHHSSDEIAPQQAEWGQQFMSFSHACPVTFRWLTDLSLWNLEFGDSDLPCLIGACDKLKHLSLASCRLVGRSVLKFNAPNSVLRKLKFSRFGCTRIDLVSVPKLTWLSCYSWPYKHAPVRFGYVPRLRMVYLAARANARQAPFALSNCFSSETSKLTTLYLNFGCQMIWIQPENPKLITAMFRNLTHVALLCIFPECDLCWTLFILEAAPSLLSFSVNRDVHSCVTTPKDNAEKTNVMWEPSKDLKHLKLKLLIMTGFEKEEKVINYIRLVMERATRLKTIKLQSHTCDECISRDPESQKRYQADEANMRRIKDRITNGPSSSVEIIMG